MGLVKSARQRRAVTLLEVAQAAGVSKATAAQVCRGQGRISPEKRRLVLDMARQLNYLPNALATSLAKRRTNIIGFYMNRTFVDLHTPFITEVLSGLQAACNQHRQDLLLHGTFHSDEPYDIYAELACGKTDGLILISWREDPLVKCLVNSHLPVVALTDPIPKLCSVTVDDAAGSRLLAAHLDAHGHRHVVYRRCPFEHLSSTARRQAAFALEAEQRGMCVTEVPGSGRDGPSSSSERRGTSGSIDSAPPELRDLLTAPGPNRPTAVACWNDDDAVALLRECESWGVRVPQDISVVGFDGIAPQLQPPFQLTTIHAASAVVAATAVSLLLDQIAGKEVAEETRWPVELLVGDSTQVAPVGV